MGGGVCEVISVGCCEVCGVGVGGNEVVEESGGDAGALGDSCV